MQLELTDQQIEDFRLEWKNTIISFPALVRKILDTAAANFAENPPVATEPPQGRMCLTDDELKAILEIFRDYDGCGFKGCKHAIAAALITLNSKYPQRELPAPAKEIHWIGVKERLPTEADGEYVLWLCTDGSVFSQSWRVRPSEFGARTAWMPASALPDFVKPDEPTPEEIDERNFQTWWGKWRATHADQSPYPSEGVAKHMWTSIRAVK